jgi:hypothetical protein
MIARSVLEAAAALNPFALAPSLQMGAKPAAFPGSMGKIPITKPLSGKVQRTGNRLEFEDNSSRGR